MKMVNHSYQTTDFYDFLIAQREMRIDLIRTDQFDEWMRLRQELFSDLSPEFHRLEIEWLHDSQDAAAFIMSTDDGEPIGLLELSLRNFVDGCIGSPVGYIEGIFVESSHRGLGCGKRLVEFAAAWFRERGCTQMATDAELSNTTAQQFHRRLGFTERWRTVGYTKSLDEQ